MKLTKANAPYFLGHMIEAIENILEDTKDCQCAEDMSSNRMKRDSVLRNFEVLGEAAKNALKCDPDLFENYKNVPWKDICGARDIVAHQYFKLNMSIIWDGISNDLKPILVEIKRISRMALDRGDVSP